MNKEKKEQVITKKISCSFKLLKEARNMFAKSLVFVNRLIENIHNLLIEKKNIFSFLLLIGIICRLVVALRGYNCDMANFMVTSNIVKNGGNVYRDTPSYNYGPIWFLILRLIRGFSDLFQYNNETVFRLTIAFLLSLIDVGICKFINKKYGIFPAIIFILNPISIIITGFHSQFDNLALYLGILAILLIEENSNNKINLKELCGLILLGISLTTKHILFLFPLWLAIKQKSIYKKMLFLSVPILIFLMGFLPYWKEGQNGIIQNVFLYKSYNNQVFFEWFIPEIIKIFTSARFVWLLLLVTFAFVFKEKNNSDSLLLYSSIFLFSSPAIANQYLVIPLIFLSVNFNIFSFFYVVFGSLHLMSSGDGLGLDFLMPLTKYESNYKYLIVASFLFLSFVWVQFIRNKYKLFIRAE